VNQNLIKLSFVEQTDGAGLTTTSLSIAHLCRFKGRILIRDFHKDISPTLNLLFSPEQKRKFLMGASMEPGTPLWSPTLVDYYAGHVPASDFGMLCYNTRFSEVFVIPIKPPGKPMGIHENVVQKDKELITTLKDNLKPVLIIDDLPGLSSLDKIFKIDYIHIPSISTSNYTIAGLDGRHKGEAVNTAVEECLNAISLGYAKQIETTVDCFGWIYLKHQPQLASDLDLAKKKLANFKLLGAVPLAPNVEEVTKSGQLPTEFPDQNMEAFRAYDSISRIILEMIPEAAFKK